MFKKILFILILPFFLYAQWTDPRPKSIQLWHLNTSFFDSLGNVVSDSIAALSADGVTIVNNSGTFGQKVLADTATLAASAGVTAGAQLIVKQLSSSNVKGGGTFIKIPKGYSTSIISGISFTNADGDTLLREAVFNGEPLNIDWFGVKKDNSTDDLVALQAAIDAAEALKRPLEANPGICVISDSLLIPRRNFVFRGTRNPISTQHDSSLAFTIRTTNANSPILHIPGSTGSNLKYVTIENMNLHYSGSGSTKPAIIAGSSVAGYSGDFFYVRNVVILNTKDAIEARGLGNIHIFNVSGNNTYSAGRYGVKLSGTSVGNSSEINFSGAGWDTLYHVTASSGGLVINGGDNGEAKRFLHAVSGSQVTVMNTNWERCVGGEWVYLSGSYGVFINNRFNQNLGGGGLVRPTWNIAGSTLEVLNYFKSQDTVDVVTASTNNTYFSAQPIKVLYTTTGDTFTVANRFSIPRAVYESATALYRGREVFTFNTGTEQDRLQLHYQGRGGNPKVAELIGPDFQYSTTGASHAFVSGIDQVLGSKGVTMNTGSDTTQVVVDVGAYSTSGGLYSAIGTFFPQGVTDSTYSVALKSATAATGKVVFIVYHPKTATGTHYLSYFIIVRRDD